MNQECYDRCLSLLKQELVPAFGCTEPIAIAYAAAKARDVLGGVPDRMVVSCSGNIVKNVQGVVVPATGGLKGLEAAALIGVAGGDAERGLEVLRRIGEGERKEAQRLLEAKICQVRLLATGKKLHIIIEVFRGQESALVEIRDTHTGIVRMEKNGETVFRVGEETGGEQGEEERNVDFLNFELICEFADLVSISDVKETLDKQIAYNTSIADFGLTHDFGANVGAGLLEAYGTDVRVLARALPAAGSDARMAGCEMPVVINSGSGNQGMTVSLPVIAYARELQVDEEELYRALCISNLTAIYQKKEIGRLSAYCGAVSAGAGAGAGIAYLLEGGAAEISSVVSNTLANVAGIICDGAKASCAAKIASSVEAALMAIHQTFRGKSFPAGEGIVKQDGDRTVKTVGMIAREGMRETDQRILEVMTSA